MCGKLSPDEPEDVRRQDDDGEGVECLEDFLAPEANVSRDSCFTMRFEFFSKHFSSIVSRGIDGRLEIDRRR